MKDKRGFSVVEIIAALALLAVLITVIVPTLITFVERERFKNDQRTAAEMTTAFQALATSIDPLDLDGFTAYDVIEALTNTGDYSEDDFIAEAQDTGFFYIAEGRLIVANRFSKMASIVLRGRPLAHDSSSAIPIHFESPEELFGRGIHLMSLEGSIVAELVKSLYDLAESGSQLRQDYDRIQNRLTSQHPDKTINQIRGRFIETLDADVHRIVSYLVDYYHPDKTLFVNELNWRHGPNVQLPIETILFTRGLTSIPSFLDGSAVTVSGTISLPRTVRTIEDKAFPNSVFAGVTITSRSNRQISVAPDAFYVDAPERDLVINAIRTQGSFDLEDLVDYSHLVSLSFAIPDELKDLIGEGPISNFVRVDLSQLTPIVEVKSYNVVIREEILPPEHALSESHGLLVVMVYIYTPEGLTGFAEIEELYERP